MKVGIIVLSWNSRKFMDDCLAGLLRHEQRPIYVVDNGSEDGSVEHIRANYPSVTLVPMNANLGFGSGNNVGIKRAMQDGCDAVFLLNNDTIIDRPFVDACIDVMRQHPRAGIVGPVTVDGHAPDRVQSAGGDIHAMTLHFPYRGRGERYGTSSRVEEVGYVLGAAMMIRREVIEEVGVFDPEYYPAYVEEVDLCYRAARAGWSSWITWASRVRHIGEGSSGTKRSTFQRMQRNLYYFALKNLDPARFLVAANLLVWRATVRRLARRPG